METDPIDVTCAIIEWEGTVLVAQRGARMDRPYRWEFPGGKVKIGETQLECIRREIKEELGLQINPVERLEACVYAYADKTIRLIPFVSEYTGGTIVLREHRDCRWVNCADLSGMAWCEADLQVLERYLARREGRA